MFNNPNTIGISILHLSVRADFNVYNKDYFLNVSHFKHEMQFMFFFFGNVSYFRIFVAIKYILNNIRR